MEIYTTIRCAQRGAAPTFCAVLPQRAGSAAGHSIGGRGARGLDGMGEGACCYFALSFSVTMGMLHINERENGVRENGSAALV